MSDPRLLPLLRTHQTREFTDQPVDEADLTALADVAQWSGSSANSQPWRFIVIREAATLRKIGEAGMPSTRSLATAGAAIAITMPDEKERAVSHAYDEGRAAERILVGATILGLGAAITWMQGDARATVHDLLGLPADRRVRTVVAIGHAQKAAAKPRSTGGKARLPRGEVIFEEHWPAD